MDQWKVEYSNVENIKLFIGEFRKAFGNEELVKEVFTCGFCYHFACMLNNLFDGRIMYNPIDNHFAFMDSQEYSLWDICGKIDDRDDPIPFHTCWYEWKIYQLEDPIESKRIMEQCVYKIGG